MKSPLVTLLNTLDHLPIPGYWRLRRFINNRRYLHLQETPYLDGKILASPLMKMERDLVNGSLYEPVIIQTIQHFVREGFNFIDVGANIGLHTLAAAFASRGGAAHDDTITVHAFELEPFTFSRLSTHIRLNQLHQVAAHPVGMGEREGTLRLNIAVSRNNGNHTLIEREGTLPGPTVRISTMDKELLPATLAEVPHLVKIDVEGFEASVLRGGKTWLARQQQLALIIECSPHLLAVQNETVQNLIALLDAAGFENYYVILDPETFDAQGNSTDPSYNMLCLKGDYAQAVFDKADESHYRAAVR
ncbi:MAG: FkbM family methyltransferase [bacterium]|nr:FkbM family methyltransferase [bacterium]